MKKTAKTVIKKADLKLNELDKECRILMKTYKCNKAAAVKKRALQIAEEAYGPDHPKTGNILNEIAGIYFVDENFASMWKFDLRFVDYKIRTRTWKYTKLISTLSDNSNFYNRVDLDKVAIMFDKRLLVAMENKLGSDHPELEGVLENIADWYDMSEMYNKAEENYKHLLRVQEKEYGEEHPLVYTLSSLAECYCKRGKYLKAEPIFNRALAILEKTSCQDQSYLPVLLSKIAKMYDAQERHEEAESLRMRTKAIITNANKDPKNTDWRYLGAMNESQKAAYEWAMR